MSSTYLVLRKSAYSFLFRSVIPKDLQTQLGSRHLQLSLKCGIRHQAKSLGLHLYNLTQQIYDSIRQSPAEEQLTPQQIKDRLKLESEHLKILNQSILPIRSQLKKKLSQHLYSNKLILVFLLLNFLKGTYKLKQRLVILRRQSKVIKIAIS